MMKHESPFEIWGRGLTIAHGELRDLAAEVQRALDSDRAVAAPLLEFVDRLLQHHRAEDVFFFPAFRNAGRLRHGEAEFLDTLDTEHVPIHRLAIELQELGNAPKQSDPWLARVRTHLDELTALSSIHFEAEERGLTAALVAKMVTERELVAIWRDMGRNWLTR